MAGDANATTSSPNLDEIPDHVQSSSDSLTTPEDASAVSPDAPRKRSLLERARIGLAIFGGLYVFAIVLLSIPYFQRHTLYLNAVRIPFFADYNAPEKYGLSPNKTLNLHVRTADNETLGAWFILSDSYYQSLPSAPSNVSEHVTSALKQYPTVLFFHGNAATRAFSVRVQHYKAFSSRLHANVLAIDYRGFGESTGTPSEQGLVTDARAAWDWLIGQGARQEDILVIGHSLGTGVSAQLGAEMSRDGIKPRGIVLLSPFSSIREVLNTYHIFGLVPLIKPLAVIPYATGLVSRALIHKFDSLHAVPNITADVLISHAIDDWDIPYSHSEVLFEAFLEPHLPKLSLPSNPLAINSEAWSTLNAQTEKRRKTREELVTTTEIAKFGRMEEFEAQGRKVAYLRTLTGGHDYLGVQEGVQDVIGRRFGFF